MAAVLYFVTAAALLALAHRFARPLTRCAALALLLLPLCFTGRALLTNRIYAPVEMPYIAHPLSDRAAQFGVGQPHNGRLADIAFQMIPWREATRRAVASREWPLLNRFELCGDMLAASGQPAVYSPFTLVAMLLPAAISFTYTGAISFFIAGLGAFLLARELDCSTTASIFAAAGWMLSAPIALQILWPLGFAWTLLPFVLAATHRQSIALLTTALSLEIVAGHPETLLHVVTIAIIFAIVTKPSVRTAVVGAISGVLALAITAIYLLPLVDAAHQTLEYLIRRDLFARAPLRIPPGVARAALLGDLFPWMLPPRLPLPGDAVAGSVIFALAVYAALFVRTKRTMFFAILAVACALVGAQLWPFAQSLHALPLFRNALNERIGTAVPLALSILAAFAVPFDTQRLAAEAIPLVVVAVLAFIPRAAVPSLLALLLIQRIASDGSLVPTNDPRVAFPQLALFQPLNGIDAPFRITGKDSVLLPNAATMYGLEDIRGNTPMNLLALFQTFPLWSTLGAAQFHAVPDVARPFLSMMNVRFALVDVSDPIPPGWHNVTHDIWTRLIENERVLPRAFIPRNVRIGRTRDQEIIEMLGETDFGERAWLRIGGPQEERMNGTGSLTVRRHKSGLRIDVTKNFGGFVVISEAAWDGWRAYLDGHRVDTAIANHAFLGVYVPEGHHEIELRFLPQSFVIGRTITVATLLLIVGYWVIRRFR